MSKSRIVFLYLGGSLLLLMSVFPQGVVAQRARGAIEGAVRDAETGEPVEYAQLLLEEADRSTSSDGQGAFELHNLPPGLYTMKGFRIGYEPLIRNVRVSAGDTLRLTLEMSPSSLSAGEIVIEGDREEATQLIDAAMELEGRRLRQHLGTTIAETLEDEPGISMRSMGPAPARPVLRGLGGERLLVLEDGGRTGDLSATSPDHAVVVDPMTAERIEVIRGPAALVYGSNALGGVVNVVRRYMPTSRPSQPLASLAVQGQSVSTGMAAGGSFAAPVGRVLAVHADGSARRAGDIRTPVGSLSNTDLSSLNGSAGMSLIQGWGYVGVAASYYGTRYGIPGGFVGAHPDGVDVHIDRRHVETRAELLAPFAWMPRLEARGTYSRYHHEEFEANGALGVEYGLLSYHGSLIGYTSQYGPFRKGAVGLWTEYRDHASGGFAFTPSSREWTVAGFGFQDVHLGPVTAQAGLRYDLRQVRPDREEESRLIGAIRPRTFGGVSGSGSLLWHPIRPLTVGLTVMRSLRMPGIEELYSEGPHLAAYSFEVGNPELETERGFGSEIFARLQTRGVRGSLAVYRNSISNYIFPLNTGTLNFRVYLPIYQHTGAEALMHGAEGRIETRLTRRLTAQASASYVHGRLTDAETPIPLMPPLQGSLGLRHQRGALSLSADVRIAADQDRVGPFEERTKGYAALDLFGQYHFTASGLLHTIDIGVANVTDAIYRNHLSRVKSIMPEPGRNVKLLYRVLF